MYRYRYETYGTSKYARAMPKILQATAELGTALGSGLVFAGKGLYDTFTDYSGKNKILDNNIMAYPRRPKRPAFGRRRSSKKKTIKGTRSRKAYRKKRSTKPKTSLRKEVKLIKRQLNADSARHVYKSLRALDMACAVNQCNYDAHDVCTGTLIEAYMANLRYYDPAAPGTLVTASGATGTYQREIYFKNVHSVVEIRNNYQIPCKLKIYLCRPKGDTNIGPYTYYNNSIADQLIGGAGNQTTIGVYPTDLNAFNQQWSCKCVKDVYLDAGASVRASHSTGPFRYDPSLFDSHSLDYQSKFKSFVWFYRLEGAFGHDSGGADQQTTLSAQIDIFCDTRVEIIYDAGIVLDDLYVSNARASSFTNGGVVTNKPIADNQALSVA